MPIEGVVLARDGDDVVVRLLEMPSFILAKIVSAAEAHQARRLN